MNVNNILAPLKRRNALAGGTSERIDTVVHLFCMKTSSVNILWCSLILENWGVYLKLSIIKRKLILTSYLLQTFFFMILDIFFFFLEEEHKTKYL